MRTVYRDRESIRTKNAVSCDSDYVPKQIGQLASEATQSRETLARISREKDVPGYVRVDATYKMWLITKEFNMMLQSIGYLPNIALKVTADIQHNICEPPGLDQLAREVELLGRLLEQDNSEDKEVIKIFSELKTLLLRSTASSMVKQIEGQISERQEDD